MFGTLEPLSPFSLKCTTRSFSESVSTFISPEEFVSEDTVRRLRRALPVGDVPNFPVLPPHDHEDTRFPHPRMRCTHRDPQSQTRIANFDTSERKSVSDFHSFLTTLLEFVFQKSYCFPHTLQMFRIQITLSGFHLKTSSRLFSYDCILLDLLQSFRQFLTSFHQFISLSFQYRETFLDK